jgi:hypothetical protein
VFVHPRSRLEMPRTKSSRSNTLKQTLPSEPKTEATDVRTLERMWQVFSQKTQTPAAAKDLVGTLREYTSLLEKIQRSHDHAVNIHESFLHMVEQERVQSIPANPAKDRDSDTAPQEPATMRSIEEIGRMYTQLQEMHNNTIAELSTSTIPHHSHGQQGQQEGGGGSSSSSSTNTSNLENLLHVYKESALLHAELVHALDQDFRIEKA